MHEPVETIESEEHEGWKVEIFQDWDASSPADWDQLGTLVAFDRLWGEYRFTQERSSTTDDEAVHRRGTALLERYHRLVLENEIIPFRFDDYGSSGARLYAVDYDTDNPSGYIYVHRADIVKEYGDYSDASRARARECLECELQAWGQYVEGDVYGYVVEGPDGDHYDSCWGFYGFEYACQEARQQLEWAIQHEKEELKKIERSVAL